VRAAAISIASGLLDEWREGKQLSDSIFQAGSTFPLTLGGDTAAFVEPLHCR
jgi:hypothetical protein